jgi:hypothetical protein
MARRHADALAISDGASNPSGIARAIVAAIDEVRAEPDHRGTEQVCRDPAVRLMVHQLSAVCGQEFGMSLEDFGQCRKACQQHGS